MCFSWKLQVMRRLYPAGNPYDDAILLINEDTCLSRGYTSLLKSFIDDLLTLGDGYCLLDIERLIPPKQAAGIRSAMIKRQNGKRL